MITPIQILELALLGWASVAATIAAAKKCGAGAAEIKPIPVEESIPIEESRETAMESSKEPSREAEPLLGERIAEAAIRICRVLKDDYKSMKTCVNEWTEKLQALQQQH